MASDSPSPLSDALGAIAPKLVSCAERDPAFRNALLELAVQVQRTLVQQVAEAGTAAVANSSAGSPQPVAAERRATKEVAAKEAPAKGGSKSAGSDEDRRRIRSAKEFRADISLVPRRSALKAKGCELAVRLLDEGETAELLHAIEEARAQAKKISDCQLWMLDPRAPEMTPADLRQCAECYTNLSRAVDLADRDEQRRGLDEAPSKRLMLAVAEAQSAVYATLSARGQRGDRDQLQTFGWLRERTDFYRVFIPRFMDRNRLADPAEWQDLRGRLERLERAHEEPTLAAEVS